MWPRPSITTTSLGCSGRRKLQRGAQRAIRELVKELAGDEVAGGIRILYGGSVKVDSVAEIVSKPDVDGGLIGGASLVGEEFAKLAANAANALS